jgi:hypothetical protein
MNWYKKSNIQNLSKIATQFRSQMVKCYDDDCLKALCLQVSRKLKEYLITKGYDATVVQGVFRIDNPDPEALAEMDTKDWTEQEIEEAQYTPLHYWVEINNLIIDVNHPFLKGGACD